MGGSYYSFPCLILSTEKDYKTPQRYPDVPTTSRRISLRSMDSRTIDQSAGGKLRDRNTKESWALLEDLALYDNESWNDPRDFAKPVKAISLPQYVPSTSDRRLIELENQVQRLMEAHLAPKQPTQVKKITSSCEICSGPHDTHFMASQDARLSKFEADFKQQQSEMTNKINTVLKAITDRIARALPSDTVKNLKLNVNSTSPVLFARVLSNSTNDPTAISKTGPSRGDEEGEIEWVDVEEHLDLVDTYNVLFNIGKARALQSLDDDTYERPNASEVIIQLRKALEYQVDLAFVMDLLFLLNSSILLKQVPCHYLAGWSLNFVVRSYERYNDISSWCRSTTKQVSAAYGSNGQNLKI
ncbi:hypothetical protein Tco_0120649 [Tanacetum coccineum]